MHLILQVLSPDLCVQIMHERDGADISWQGTDPLAHGVLKWNGDQDWPQINMYCEKNALASSSIVLQRLLNKL